MKDILIIGSGICGSSIARELSRYNASIVVLEKGNDVSIGTTKANSGIVHSGLDAHPNSTKAKYNVLGNAMFDELSRTLDFPFRRNGSLVLCFDDAQHGELDKLLAKGIANGVKGLEIISGDKVRQMEPNVSQQVVSAIFAPSGGIVSPYEMNIAYAENACVNGAEFEFGKEVVSIVNKQDHFVTRCKDGTEYSSKVVVNCAGVHSDIINNMVCDKKFDIVARRGEYILLDKVNGYLCDKTLFQLPTAMGKGVLVTPTTHGNILIGPTARDIDNKSDVNTTVDGLSEVFVKASATIPAISRRMIITQFAGLRAHEHGDDFIVGESQVKGFYNVAGIESPGLSAAPAIAVDIATQISSQLHLQTKTNFVSQRKAIPHFATMSNQQRSALIDSNPLYGKIVCRCEVVTEGEIVDSIKRPLGATDLDGVKRRVRAGMGRCQAGFCTARVMQIISRETDVSLEQITKGGGQSNIVVGRTK